MTDQGDWRLAGKGHAGPLRRYLPVVLTACIGCFLAIAGCYFTHKFERESRQEAFNQIAEDQIRAVQSKLESTFTILRSIRGLFLASIKVDRDEFQTFLKTQNLDASIQALEWIPRVPASDRLQNEEEARLEGHPEFRIWEHDEEGRSVAAGERDEFFPVYYVEPLSQNQAALGYDFGSNKLRLLALHRARDSGKINASARTTLIQEIGDQHGMLVIAPIYQNGRSVDTVDERREHLAGFAVGVLRIGDLIDTAIGVGTDSTPVASVRVFDKSAPKRSQLLYPKDSTATDPAEARPALYFSQAFDVGGRSWLVEVTPIPASKFSSVIWQPWAVLVVGLLFTGLLALHLALSANRTAQVEELVGQRTVELEKTANELARSNADLEQFAFVASHDLRAPLRGIENLAKWIEEDLDEVLVGETRSNMGLLRGRVKRLDKLLDDLLQFSRAGRAQEETSVVDTKSLLDEIIEISSVPNGIAISAKGDLPTFETTKTPLEQVLRNLIGNAVKHHDREDGKVEITTKDMGDRLLFTVSDDGPGIEPEFHEKVFKMFQTLRPRDEVEGSGMGLAIVRKLVERQGGEIHLHSAPSSRGATFQFDWKKT